MHQKRRVIIYVATSLDGYIATAEGELNWLALAEKANEDYGYSDFIKNIDTVIMGRKTYDKVRSFGIEFPHKDKQLIILTRQKFPPLENTTYYDGDLEKLIRELKSQPGKNIYVDGGTDVIHQMMISNLVDEFIITVVPILLGHGMPLFMDHRPEMQIRHISTKTFDTGVVQSHYKRIACKTTLIAS
ncbi:MAG: dihydrofolate reductase family protein [Syntrophothermus sp.]